MNNINTTPFGAAEHCALDNWAAEYAKKLFVSEAAKRTEDINNEKIAREAADNAEIQARAAADTEEARVRAAADTEEAQARAAADTEEAQARAAADTVLDNKKVNRNEYATETTAGIVTLHRGSANNSGLLVGSKGELAVNVSPDGRYGLTRDGVGQIKTFAATEAEIKEGTNAYKPIVPNTLSAAVEKVTGKRSELITSDKTSFTAAVNELNEKIDKKETMDIYSTTPQRIGTWIDGTPIWRVVFQREITEQDRIDKSVSISVPIINKNSFFVLNAWGQTYASVPCAIDDVLLNFDNGVVFTGDAIANKLFDGVYGWIEFATPHSNMKYPYTDPDSAVDTEQGKDEGGENIGDETGGENSGGSSGDDITFPDPSEDESDNIT